MPPSGGGRRALFSPADGLLARAALRPGVPPCGLGCPVRPVVSCVLWGGPVRPAVPCAPWDALCALGCPVRPGMPPCTLALPRTPLRCPRTPLRCPAGLPQPCGALRPAIQSAPLPCLATTLSPAPRRPSAPPRRARQRKSPAAPKGAAGPCSFRCQAMRLR